MKVIPSTTFRKHISRVLNTVVYHNQVIGVGRHKKVEAILLKWPARYNKELDEITNLNANSSSFEFLMQEPDIYSIDDLRKRYV